jgi:hypothetical protein
MTEAVAPRSDESGGYQVRAAATRLSPAVTLLRLRLSSRGCFSIGAMLGIPDLLFRLSARWA